MTCQFLTIFNGPEEAHEASQKDQKSPEPSTRVEGAPYPPGRAPYLVDDSETEGVLDCGVLGRPGYATWAGLIGHEDTR